MDLYETQDSVEATRLLVTGGQLKRVAHDLVVDLRAFKLPLLASPPRGLQLAPLGCDPDEIAVAAASAMTPDHVDFAIWTEIDRMEYWRRLVAGDGPCGVNLPEPSRVLRSGLAIVGAVVVTDMPATDWWEGNPSLPELFVVSDSQGCGLGGVLLGHALRTCAEAGSMSLSLTVSDRNPARNLYKRFGFQPFRVTWSIRPGGRAAH